MSTPNPKSTSIDRDPGAWDDWPMITALIAGIAFLSLGVLAHGLLAQLAILFVAWLAKNGMLLAFLKTRLGRHLIRVARWNAYAFSGDSPQRRKAYRLFKRTARTEKRVSAALERIRALLASTLLPPAKGNPRRRVKGRNGQILKSRNISARGGG